VVDREDLGSLAKTFSINQRHFHEVLEAIHIATGTWETVCSNLGIREQRMDKIRDTWEFPRSALTW